MKSWRYSYGICVTVTGSDSFYFIFVYWFSLVAFTSVAIFNQFFLLSGAISSLLQVLHVLGEMQRLTLRAPDAPWLQEPCWPCVAHDLEDLDWVKGSDLDPLQTYT